MMNYYYGLIGGLWVEVLKYIASAGAAYLLYKIIKTGTNTSKG